MFEMVDNKCDKLCGRELFKLGYKCHFKLKYFFCVKYSSSECKTIFRESKEVRLKQVQKSKSNENEKG